jgi:hypothetical protein
VKGKMMGALFKRKCEACGNVHQLLLSEGDFRNELKFRFEYTCPATGETVDVIASEHDEYEDEIVNYRPPDSIIVRRIPKD